MGDQNRMACGQCGGVWLSWRQEDGDLCETCDGHNRGYEAGLAAGIAKERGAVVAWLRDRWVDVAGKFMARELPDMERAEQIERGDHVTPREAEEGKGT